MWQMLLTDLKQLFRNVTQSKLYERVSTFSRVANSVECAFLEDKAIRRVVFCKLHSTTYSQSSQSQLTLRLARPFANLDGVIWYRLLEYSP